MDEDRYIGVVTRSPTRIIKLFQHNEVLYTQCNGNTRDYESNTYVTHSKINKELSDKIKKDEFTDAFIILKDFDAVDAWAKSQREKK